jgi:branched-chain amino acid transport system substrate-binding protein
LNAPIRIGEINTYSPSALSGFMATYRKGVELAVSEVNVAGGVLGRPLEVLFRDDELSTGVAAQRAEELLLKDKVDLIAGTFTSDVGVSVAKVADRLRRVFVATEPRTDALVWQGGSRYVFRIRTSQSMMVSMLVSHAAKMPERRWAIVAPSYEGGRRIAAIFRDRLTALRPDVAITGEHYFTLGKMNADVVREIARGDPQAIFTVVYGSDLLPFVREGTAQRLFDGRQVVNPLAGDPEYLDTLGAETPEGWLVLGYPAEADRRPEHQAFAAAYRKATGLPPDAAALTGYIGFQAIAAGIRRAGSVDTEALVRGFRGLEFDSPIGRLTVRAGDHQATVGHWIGRLACRNGRGVLVDWEFLDGAAFLPPEAQAAAMRPAAARA